jgi:hypothetical protein
MNYIVIIGILIIIILAIFGERIYTKIIETLWSKENPDKINGTKVKLGEFDNLGPNPPKQLVGVITHCSDNKYRVDFVEPLMRDGVMENYATITARHAGHPISRMSKRGILAVCGSFESGHGFIALVARAK